MEDLGSIDPFLPTFLEETESESGTSLKTPNTYLTHTRSDISDCNIPPQITTLFRRCSLYCT